MKIELKNIYVGDLVKNYSDNQDDGVFGYDGKLDIRPPYQRQFIYKDEQREAVIDTLFKGFPLNVMYWSKREDGNFEVIDGQQRTISICQYVSGVFSFKNRFFANLQEDEKAKILNYKLFIYQCEGTSSEKLEWFKIINIAGEKLTPQELRNAVYAGSWVSDAKKYFSKNGCVAHNIANQYMKGSAIRQEYLETVIKWLSQNKIEEYMAKNQNKSNANELWLYFQNVINWVNLLFSEYRKEMKGVDWGFLYNKFYKNSYDAKAIETEVSQLMQDQDVTKKAGIYTYIFKRQERHLNIRAFDQRQKREAYERQERVCATCRKEFDPDDMEADHITPWSEGGQTVSNNCQMLCKECNRRKGAV